MARKATSPMAYGDTTDTQRHTATYAHHPSEIHPSEREAHLSGKRHSTTFKEPHAVTSSVVDNENRLSLKVNTWKWNQLPLIFSVVTCFWSPNTYRDIGLTRLRSALANYLDSLSNFHQFHLKNYLTNTFYFLLGSCLKSRASPTHQ